MIRPPPSSVVDSPDHALQSVVFNSFGHLRGRAGTKNGRPRYPICAVGSITCSYDDGRAGHIEPDLAAALLEEIDHTPWCGVDSSASRAVDMPCIEDFSADFSKRGIEGHKYGEGLWHVWQPDDPTSQDSRVIVPHSVSGMCPRRDVPQRKDPAPPVLRALVLATRALNARNLEEMERRLVTHGVSPAAAKAAAFGAFRDVAVQLHSGTPVPADSAQRSIRHSDTIMSLLHLSLSLRGRRGVCFELYDASDAGNKQCRAVRLAAQAGDWYLTCPTAAFHYPFFPFAEPMVAVQLRILSPPPDALAELYTSGSYREGLSERGLAAIACVHELLLRPPTPWAVPKWEEVRAHMAKDAGETGKSPIQPEVRADDQLLDPRGAV